MIKNLKDLTIFGIWDLFLLMDPKFHYDTRNSPIILSWTQIVASRIETLNCDISSLESDTWMVDHSMNKKFECASYSLEDKHFLYDIKKLMEQENINTKEILHNYPLQFTN